MLRHVVEHGQSRESYFARVTLDRECHVPVASPALMQQWRDAVEPLTKRKTRRVFDAGGRELLPGKLVLDETNPHAEADRQAREAFDSLGSTYDLFANAYLRNSIDEKGMRIEASVHYGPDYKNACWNGRQMIFGEGDGVLFTGFTSLDVVAHELTHGVIQFSGRLPYFGQAGAVAEHIADAFAQQVVQFNLAQTAVQADWRIGAGVLSPAVNGTALRSMINPGTAYDDPVLGRDPQPCHMRDYVDSAEDNGGVHVNSGILNRAFAMAAIALGGYTWTCIGRIWYRVLKTSLTPATTFRSFASDTVRVAGELFGHGDVQRTVADAWAAVGIPVRSRAAEGARSIVERVRQKFPLFILHPNRKTQGVTVSHSNLFRISYEEIDQHMKTVDLADLRDGQTFLPEAPETRVEQLAKVYRAVRPVLNILIAFPIPPTWRAAVTLLLQAIEGVVTPGATTDFKAGRDLEE